MPFIAPRGNASQPQKPPWVRDPSSNQQPAEAPWRKQNQQNVQQKPSARPNILPQAVVPATEPPKQGTSKLQINLKSTVKKPPAEESGFKVPEVKLQPIPVVPPPVSAAAPPPTKETPPVAVDSKKKANVKSIPIKINIESAANVPSKEESSKTKKPPPSGSPLLPQKMSTENGVVTGKPPPPPPLPPSSGPPPPPPPPPMMPGMDKKPPRPEVAQKLEQLRKQPRRRPDWGTMMKEIETGRKLKHVQCNDRSKPIIPRMKSLGKFVFDSEAKPASKTDAIHNRLLTEIQGGVRLKKVQCNDRSRPQLSGLRKFRRQNTLEEKQKGPGIPEETPEEVTFELDDIDVLRDDLQSAKQMLEMEVQAKIHLGKENRDFKCQIITLEAENQTLKAQLGLIPEEELSMLTKGLDRKDSKSNLKDLRKSRSGLYKSPSIAGIKRSKSGVGDKAPKPSNDDDDLGEMNELEEEIDTLKGQVQQAKKTADDWEAKFKELSKQLLVAQGKLEDSEQKCIMLEKKLENTQNQKGIVSVALGEKWTQTEEQILERRISRQMSSKGTIPEGNEAQAAQNSQQYQYESGSEGDDSDLELDEETVIRKKQEREIKLWENKLKSIKEKQTASKMERRNLKIAQKKFEEELKMSKQHHKELQKEVEKMAKMLKASELDEDDEEEKEEGEEEEEEEEEESEEEESESETDDEEESSSEEDDEDEGHDDRLALFNKRVKRRENILNALRKGNYLLRANIDRLKDDLEEARIKYHDLQHELNTVLSDV